MSRRFGVATTERSSSWGRRIDVALVYLEGDLTGFHLDVEAQLFHQFPAGTHQQGHQSSLAIARVPVERVQQGTSIETFLTYSQNIGIIRDASLAVILANCCGDTEQQEHLLQVVQQAGAQVKLVVLRSSPLEAQQVGNPTAQPFHEDQPGCIHILHLQLDEGCDLAQYVADKAAGLLASLNYLPVSKPCLLPDVLVGITAAALGKLQDAASHGVRMLFLHGMGGAGKTVRAMWLFNRMHEADPTALCHVMHFNGENVSVVDAQKALLACSAYVHDVQFSTETHGRQAVHQQLQGKRVILLLDNVSPSLLVRLLPEVLLDSLAPGSMLIVTSRESLADGYFGSSIMEVAVEGLSYRDSVELFCQHAYQQPGPLAGEEELVECLVRRCGGLPMALEVLAKHVSQSPRRHRILRRLEEELRGAYKYQQSGQLDAHRTMFEAIDASWAVLSHSERMALLDVAWFLGAPQAGSLETMQATAPDLACAAQPWELASLFCGVEQGLPVLEGLLKQSLALRLRGVGCELVGVHNVIHDYCKLWLQQHAHNRLEIESGRSKANLAELLQQVASADVEGLNLKRWLLNTDACAQLPILSALRLLWLQQAELAGPELHMASASLRWLSLTGGLSGHQLQRRVTLDLKMEALLILELRQLSELLQLNGLSSCCQLQHLSVVECTGLVQLDLHGLTKLRQLRLDNCSRLTDVLHISTLQALTEVLISQCDLLAATPVDCGSGSQHSNADGFTGRRVSALIPRPSTAKVLNGSIFFDAVNHMDSLSPREPTSRGGPDLGRGGCSSPSSSSGLQPTVAAVAGSSTSTAAPAPPCLNLAAGRPHDAARPSTSSDMAPAVDQDVAADYEVLRFIGRGKFSQAFVARERWTGRMVVLKKVPISKVMDNQAPNDCIREVSMLQSLHHPNILQCYSSFMENNELNIVLEWAEAGDLANILQMRRDRQQPFTTPEILSYFQQMCEALKHMHDNRIMHRNLKPSNVFVTAQGVVKVGDLGFSHHFSSQTDVVQDVVGTPCDMSPERITRMSYSFSSDVWSLGCMLYELIALRSPFEKEGLNFDLQELGKLITSGTYDPLPATCPPYLAHLVSRMLEQDPSLHPDINEVLRYLTSAPQQ